MALTTKVVELDGSGSGDVTVAPMFYLGASEPVTVEAGTAGGHNNIELGDEFRTYKDGQFVVGGIHVSGGTPDSDLALYFFTD